MLDFVQLSAQVNRFSHDLKQESQRRQSRVQLAQESYARWAETPCEHTLRRGEQQWMRDPQWSALLPSTVPFAQAAPVQPAVEVIPPPAQHTVIASDGSQLAPNHHDIAYCTLLNIGLVVLPYGTGQRPLLRSVPHLLHQTAEEGLDSETALAWHRTVEEMRVLVNHALSLASGGTLGAPPMLALVDGSLLTWGLDGLPQDVQQRCLAPWLACLDHLQQAGIPIIGYISAPRSSEVLGFLRTQRCPHDQPLCHQHCAQGTPPCQVFGGVQDRHLWGSLLSPGQTSPVWQSGARILQHYGPHQIQCCYLHVGSEVARLEFPAWVAGDRQRLALSLGMVLSQVQKGRGYPISLAEAHHLAVVKGADRQRFLALLERELIREGLHQVEVSPKLSRKRHTVV